MEITVPADGYTPPNPERQFQIGFDSAQAAGSTLGASFPGGQDLTSSRACGPTRSPDQLRPESVARHASWCLPVGRPDGHGRLTEPVCVCRLAAARVHHPNGDIAFVPLLLAGAAALYAQHEAVREIDLATSMNPHANMLAAGLRGAGKAGVVTAVSLLTGGAGEALAARMGAGGLLRYSMAGATGGFGVTLGEDVFDVGIMHGRGLSSPGRYLANTALGAGLAVGAYGMEAGIGWAAQKVLPGKVGGMVAAGQATEAGALSYREFRSINTGRFDRPGLTGAWKQYKGGVPGNYLTREPGLLPADIAAFLGGALVACSPKLAERRALDPPGE